MDRNNRPQFGGQPPPQRIQFGIQEMLGIHGHFSDLKQKGTLSPELDKARTKLETHIINFIDGLQSAGPNQ